ncbi:MULTISPECIES: guanylate kinase [Corallincola]|uniref:Guanylate kinase n=3 Tax=Corallincola TaxID=1775176 RepID=A0A368NM89_9GAMM|nr:MULTISPECIES: guanylate kinase [Corallincola]RCU51013.1 guanylate kinase [Corallincola holothuriorum]TAA45965.1 guanylate kinase [Corallincola spongiicola]TCI04073.1 guanylate kinase [Corallincola luteus]
MNAPGTLFIVSAPSGAGKSSLIAALLARHQQATMEVSISHTTRQARPGEENGKHYHFVSVAEFKSLITADAFFEHAEVFGNFYGTSKVNIQQRLQAGVDIFLDIDWQGAEQVRQQMPEAKSIFILPPSQAILEQRLSHRGQDSAEVIAQRMTKARAEMSHYPEYDFLIINDEFEKALDDLDAIVRCHGLRRTGQAIRHNDMLKQLLAE